MKKDLILGSYTNYTWDQIKYWANSINASGFTGDKCMIVYNSDRQTVDKLRSMGFMIYHFEESEQRYEFRELNFSIVVRRFLDLYNFLRITDLSEYRYVIHTDVKDVIFQSNPSDWLTQVSSAKIIASSESLKYKNEEWGASNMRASYHPFVAEPMMDRVIYNCGVQAGDARFMRDFWRDLYLMSKGGATHNPDQAAYNILLTSEAVKSQAQFVSGDDTWACQAGTTADPFKIARFRPHLLDPEPIFKDGCVYNSKGEKFCIVHQYDRIPHWKSIIEDLYK